MAAALDNPALVARWRRSPRTIERHGVDPATLDLDVLERFAGLATKVRHNGLRPYMPCTFRLLALTGLEIEFFAACARSRARQGLALAGTTGQRLDDLVAFAQEWVDPRKRDHRLLLDLMHHEQALHRLSVAPPSPAPSRARPSIDGAVELHEMSCNVQRLAEVVTRNAFRPQDFPRRRRRYLAYWRARTASASSIVELDEFSFALLGNLDGQRTASEISLALLRTRVPPPAMLRRLSELSAAGIVAWRGDARRAA
jgi:hypothetical protein